MAIPRCIPISVDWKIRMEKLERSPLVHHLSLPRTTSEMVAAENYLQFSQDMTARCQVRAKRGCATHPRSIAERVRRTRISENMKKLQDLFPNMDKQTNTAEMLELAVEYIKNLQKQVQTLTDTRAKLKVALHRLILALVPGSEASYFAISPAHAKYLNYKQLSISSDTALLEKLSLGFFKIEMFFCYILNFCISFLENKWNDLEQGSSVTWFKVGSALIRELHGHATINARNRGAVDEHTETGLPQSFDRCTASLVWRDRAEWGDCRPARYELNKGGEEGATTGMALAFLHQSSHRQHKHQQRQGLRFRKLHDRVVRSLYLES
ncbi:UNVERIFIED_CONTAM: Transcription factor [Sesamum calycinum]|uniref:Transcription factor n=1 Tax=Sesamum calycinum TaxID=2727403 RepID=A0AAW2J6C2_9LAMI